MSRVALVTGANGGIGNAICQKLKQDGFTVVGAALGVDDEDGKKWQQQTGIDLIYCDVSNFESCENLAKTIKEKHGNVSVIVNNAGITKDTQLKNMTKDQWQAVLRVNLDSVFNVSRQFINDMLADKWGRIINISSINGQKGQFGQTNYCAAKSGMHGFTMSLAQETARSGVTVNTVSPGYTATPMVTAIREDILETIVNQIPMKRLAKPEEIGAAVAYLCSQEAAFISGANLPVNGAQFTSF